MKIKTKTRLFAGFFVAVVVAIGTLASCMSTDNVESIWNDYEKNRSGSVVETEDKTEEIETSNIVNDVANGNNVVNGNVTSTDNKNVNLSTTKEESNTNATNDTNAKYEKTIADLEERLAQKTEENDYLKAENKNKDEVIVAQREELVKSSNPFKFDENGNLTCDFEYAEKAARRQNADGTWYYLIQKGKKLITTDIRTCSWYSPKYLDNHFEAARKDYQIIGKAGEQYGVYSIASGGVAYLGEAKVNGYALVDTTKQNGKGGDFAAIFYNSFVYVEDESAEYGYSVYLAGDYVAPKASTNTKTDDSKTDNTVVVKETNEICFICGLDRDHCPGHVTKETITKTIEVEKKVCTICGKPADECKGHVEKVKETEYIYVPGETKTEYIYIKDPEQENNPQDEDEDKKPAGELDDSTKEGNPNNNPEDSDANIPARSTTSITEDSTDVDVANDSTTNTTEDSADVANDSTTNTTEDSADVTNDSTTNTTEDSTDVTNDSTTNTTEDSADVTNDSTDGTIYEKGNGGSIEEAKNSEQADDISIC